jgi:hypothetical protein
MASVMSSFHKTSFKKAKKMGTDNEPIADLSLFLADLSLFFFGCIIILRSESHSIISTYNATSNVCTQALGL